MINPKYDRDPEALAWARAKVELEIARVLHWRRAADTGKRRGEASVWVRTARFMRTRLVGDPDHDLVAAFDARRPYLPDDQLQPEPVTDRKPRNRRRRGGPTDV